MIIPPKRPHLVVLEEQCDDQYIRIKRAEMIVQASDIKEACEEVEKYFGMGIKIIITKCELLK